MTLMMPSLLTPDVPLDSFCPLPLSITRRGDFFTDSFFEDARQDFRSAVRQILRTYNSLLPVDDLALSCYRRFTQRQFSEDTQACRTIEDQGQYKIVIDAHGFSEKDIKVKAFGANEITVEGSHEDQRGGASSRRTFRRYFRLPSFVSISEAKSVLSVDGILTVTVPKIQAIETLRPVVIPVENVPSLVAETQKEQVVRVTETATAATPIAAEISTQQSVGQSQESIKGQMVQKESSRDLCRQPDTKVAAYPNVTSLFGELVPAPSQFSLLPVMTRGPFFHDSFFEKAREHFVSAVKEVLDRSQMSPMMFDDVSRYWTLRDKEMKEENQASFIREDGEHYKVSVDTAGFGEQDILVKTNDQNQLLVEGHAEAKEGEATSRRSFRKLFSLSGFGDLNEISASRSSDGILTIHVPKKKTAEKIIPISNA